MKWFRWWWLALLIPICAGFARLHFDVEVLDLLPPGVPAVQGLKVYQKHFANARELIITIRAPDRDTASRAAKSVADNLLRATNLVADATWEPPWLEHPGQTAELMAFLWLNQPPQQFGQLAAQLAETNLANILAATRDQLSTSLSPAEIAQLSYDPFGLTRLPANVTSAAPGFGQGDELFASPDGTFRIIFVKARGDLPGYRECTDWLNAVKNITVAALPPGGHVSVGYTGRPAFVAEISGSMKHDIILSAGGTSVIIAILFWLAHRRVKPMLWLLTLLALILGATLGLGGLVFGAINVISMGFAAILLGLAVDYAVVHYQEALAQPHLSIPTIRRAIAPSIFWAAFTTISAFLVLNFGGLPGLAQLGSLVGIGVALSAFVMIFAFLPPLFPQRMHPRPHLSEAPSELPAPAPLNPFRVKIAFAVTVILILTCVAILCSGLPKMDASADALQPRNSPATLALEAMKTNLGQKREPLWLVITGHNESEVAQKLNAVLPVLNTAVSNQTLSGFTLPNALWPQPEYQAANRASARHLAGEWEALHAAALTSGFSESALGLTKSILTTWTSATATTNVFWPTNPLCAWILDKMTAREPTNFFAVGFLYPSTKATSFASLDAQLSRQGAQLSGWELLGVNIMAAVRSNMWKLLVPMVSLILLSLWLAFRRLTEIIASLAVLALSGLCLLAVMRIFGWQWNLLNLMALPLILGTGVDYSIFMQLALRRHGGDLALAHRSVGRALLLCGATAITGFGSLGLSANAGMASLGQVCAAGIAGNMLFSIFLLPIWWKYFSREKNSGPHGGQMHPPSQLYSAFLWKIGLRLPLLFPPWTLNVLARMLASLYWALAAHRRKIVRDNLLPVMDGDRQRAGAATRALFTEFALKLTDLWRYEGGATVANWYANWRGWDIFTAAGAHGRGVLLVTPHLGNWELGGEFMAHNDCKLLVLTQAEPDARLTATRQASRALRGVETIVVGQDVFAFIEIVKRLQQGATVALLVDRPPPPTAVSVTLFGRPFPASIAAAELARASGCAIVPTYIVRGPGGYRAQILPEIPYDRARIGTRESRIQLTQEILRAFEPVIRQHATQWFHFVPVWPVDQVKFQNSIIKHQ
jgi:predicted RND superfamily exporter protein/lauroyl/myristoyl acyltransferase